MDIPGMGSVEFFEDPSLRLFGHTNTLIFYYNTKGMAGIFGCYLNQKMIFFGILDRIVNEIIEQIGKMCLIYL